MTIFFTSDTHYSHGRIIEYSKRPYKDVEEMNQALINNFNSRVKPEDTCYHLGDVSFTDFKQTQSIIRRLNGNKILIRGNHDKLQNYEKIGFGSVHQYLEIKVPDEEVKSGFQHIILFHYSLRVWSKSHYGSWNLFGHSHGSLYDDPNLLSMDVGVDPCGYFPISYEEVKKKMRNKTWKPLDHHGKDRD